MLRCLPYSQAAPDFLPPQYWQFGFPFVHRQRNLGFDDLMISDDADHSVTLVVVGYPLCLIFALDIVLLGHLDLSCQFTHSLFHNMAKNVGNYCHGFQLWSILKISRRRLSRISSMSQSQNSEEEKKWTGTSSTKCSSLMKERGILHSVELHSCASSCLWHWWR